MAVIQLRHNLGFSWYHDGPVHAKGYLFDPSNALHKGGELPGYFSVCRSEQQMREALLGANGFFAVVVEADDACFAAVDRLRSIPLFYGRRNGSLYITDDANWLRTQLDDSGLDELARSEFLLTGYVVGNRTLSPSVRQLQAGELLSEDGGRVETVFYYRHLHADYLYASEHEHFDALDKVTDQISRRLVRSVDGRTIVVPLSGGYDSRYILAMLRRLDYADVVCFAYGRPDSYEVKISRRAAKALGYPWHFVEYDRAKFRDLYVSDRFRQYCIYSGNYASLPHVQEPVAVGELIGKALVPPDSIFVPGFCGDLLGGSYVPDELVMNRHEHLMRKGIADYICRRHLVLANEVSAQIMCRIRQTVAETLRDFPEVTDIAEFVSVNEAWFTCHKVAKFVVNGLRAYDFFGFEWRMPLWDNALSEYWYRIPISERIGKRLYDSYLMERVFAPLGIDFKQRPDWARSRLSLALRSILPSKVTRVLRRAYGALTGLRRVDTNAFDELYRICFEDLNSRVPLKRNENINQVLVWHYLVNIDEWAASYDAAFGRDTMAGVGRCNVSGIT